MPEVPAGPRRTGRHASTPTTTPVPETSKKGVTSKSAPPKARATPPSSTGGRKRASTGTKRSRLAQEGEGDAGGARLRKRGSVSFKEPSDDEALEGGSGADSGSDREDGPEPEPEPIESDVDVTVYSPPAAAALPEMVELRAAAGDKPALTVPSSALGDLMAAYAILRSFSWQLRLSPFTFEDFCAAMCSTQPTLLVDETHVCVLRALTADEVPTERAEHKLDLGLLDTITWPCYVWEMLRITEDPLAAHEWEHRKVPRVPEPAATPGTAAKDKSATPAAAPASGSAPNTAPTEGADRVEKAAETPGTGGNAVADGDAATPAEAAPNDSADPTPSAKVPEGSAPEAASPPFAAASQPQSRVPFSPVAVEVMDEQLKETVETTAGGHFGDHGPRPFRHQPEYYALPVELKAAILSRLCDHLMDSTTIRAEIDRREAGGEFVSGKGGEGGAFAIMTPEEKARAEAHAKKQQQSDANTDICVLCGLGGNLLCCDGCPAAYHLRCLGETGKNLGEGDWLCPECVVGGRGETAGLRIPVAARNKWKQPHYIVNGAVIQEALPAVKGSGRHAIELTQRVPAAVYPAGSAAEAALEAATKVRSGDEMPLPSTFEAVSDPPKWPEEASSAGADGYMNKYRNGWSAAVTAVRSAVEDAKRRRHKGGIWVPTGTCGRLGVPELPEPLPLSKFQWVLPQGRPMGRATTRCGKCHTCMRPTLRKGCLNPIFKAGTVLEDAQPDTSK